MGKKTLVCIHIMPNEIEMFQRFMEQYRKALSYCKDYDITIKATLNLNPKLTDWEASELKQDYFMNLFTEQFQYRGLKNINQIILDDSVWGTTQQKRESIKIDYFDQFIFVDTDIALHELQLVYQLKAAENLSGKYIISPSIPKWWDVSWDYLVHSDMKEIDPFTPTTLNGVYTQSITNVVLKQIPTIKFGCGMHTLYSREFWEFIGIPESLGGYGPEDTIAMFRSIGAIQKGYDIKQFVLDGIYITEDYINRTPSFGDKLITIDKKEELSKRGKELIESEISSFIHNI
jgi:hypothetical protein